jgi:hypothetical protein
MKDDAAQYLHVEVAQADAPLGDLPHEGERLGQNIVQRLTLAEAAAELVGLGPHIGVR